MTGLRSWAALTGAAALLLYGCGQSGSGKAASSQTALSSAPPAASSAAAAAFDTALSSAAASALPPPAAAVATVTPAAAPAPPTREPTPAELLRSDPVYIAKGRTVDALYQNARERDPTGQVDHEQSAALAELHACADRACLDRWFKRREAALRQYVEN
jgi:hypothetical protein